MQNYTKVFAFEKPASISFWMKTIGIMFWIGCHSFLPLKRFRTVHRRTIVFQLTSMVKICLLTRLSKRNIEINQIGINSLIIHCFKRIYWKIFNFYYTGTTAHRNKIGNGVVLPHLAKIDFNLTCLRLLLLNNLNFEKLFLFDDSSNRENVDNIIYCHSIEVLRFSCSSSSGVKIFLQKLRSPRQISNFITR